MLKVKVIRDEESKNIIRNEYTFEPGDATRYHMVFVPGSPDGPDMFGHGTADFVYTIMDASRLSGPGYIAEKLRLDKYTAVIVKWFYMKYVDKLMWATDGAFPPKYTTVEAAELSKYLETHHCNPLMGYAGTDGEE